MKMPSSAVCGITIVLLWLSVSSAQAASESILYSFAGFKAGAPSALTVDASGNLYGAASPTTESKYGSIFRLTRSGNLTILYQFTNGTDGQDPNGNLIFDASGNLYGTALYTSGSCACGTVFELTPTSSGSWTETTLYTFQGGSDGEQPLSGLTFDSTGNLYGTTRYGGTGTGSSCGPGCGTVFELSPNSGGGWTESVIYSFQGGIDGESPSGQLAIDASGNLYGTMGTGGGSGSCFGSSAGCGYVFEVTRSSGSWTKQVLYAFSGGTDGGGPGGGLVFDASGNIYGAAGIGGDLSGSGCGNFGCGAVFELSPGSGGLWTESVLYAFTGLSGGAYPYGGLVFNRFGRLFGMTNGGGGGTCDCGAVFKLSPSSGGSWTENTLHTFAGGKTDGAFPTGPLVVDPKGTLYGPTLDGGLHDRGTVIEIIP